MKKSFLMMRKETSCVTFDGISDALWCNVYNGCPHKCLIIKER